MVLYSRMIHASRLFFILFSILLANCTSRNEDPDTDYTREAFEFVIDTAAAAHPFCSEPQTAFDSELACQEQKKFVLRWRRPENTDGLVGYRVFLDTNPGEPPKEWDGVRARDEEASVLFLNTSSDRDR
ncbi:hypothetical protein, partial [Okeania sp. SIO1H5]|uniref:hypothetical protein n=1 Tax=Okeania sp. SIO1H5 TaxID=2607777 RepID=UPI002580CD7F